MNITAQPGEALQLRSSGPSQSTAAFGVLDVYSGIGGFALATEWAGGRTIAFAETARFPALVLRRHWPHVPNLGDATRINPPEFRALYGQPDAIVGGVPCQPASLIGERRGTEDERWLWPDTIRLMRGFRPVFGLFENPAAILSLESGRAFSGILGGLAAAGYDVQWHRVPAGALGAGHRRERIWLLASDANSARLEGYAWHGPNGGRPGSHGPIAPQDLRARTVTSPKWYTQSGIQPVVDGLPGWVAREQLTAIGNSLVPQVALVFMRVIADALVRTGQ